MSFLPAVLGFLANSHRSSRTYISEPIGLSRFDVAHPF